MRHLSEPIAAVEPGNTLLSVPVTPLQQRRYRAIVDATIAQLRSVGYDRLRIHDVAGSSGVALATIYRYFGSRENLIFTAVQGWVTETSQHSYPEDPGATLEERLTTMVRVSADRLGREPELLQAWAMARLSRDPQVTLHARRDTFATSLLIYPPEVLADEQLAQDLSVLSEHVWFAGVVKWSIGQKDFDDVWKDVMRLVRIVLRADTM